MKRGGDRVETMDFEDLVSLRRSVRSYKEQEVETDHLQAILRCANAAPSAGNLQPFEIVVVRDPGTRQALARAALGQRQVAQAPVVLAFFENPARSSGRYGRRGVERYATQDTAIACAYAQLAAAALGLASCWVGAFDDGQVSRILNVPSHLVPAALLSLGYPDESPPPTGRRPLEEMVHEERF